MRNRTMEFIWVYLNGLEDEYWEATRRHRSEIIEDPLYQIYGRLIQTLKRRSRIPELWTTQNEMITTREILEAANTIRAWIRNYQSFNNNTRHIFNERYI